MTMDLLPAFVGVPEMNRVYNVDALTLLQALPSGSVDLILTDPPYGFGKTKMDWDSNKQPFDYKLIFYECLRIINKRGAIIIFSAQPFTSDMVQIGRKYYRYSWYYQKARGSNFGNSKYQPLRVIEEVLVFSKSIASPNQFTDDSDIMRYFAQQTRLDQPYTRTDKMNHVRLVSPSKSSHVHNPKPAIHYYEYTTPKNILYAPIDRERGLHPTQKPIAICEYFISTYTQPNMLVIDPFAGSGTTALAARNLGRRFIAGDIMPEYVEIARHRLAMPYTPPLFEMG